MEEVPKLDLELFDSRSTFLLSFDDTQELTDPDDLRGSGDLCLLHPAITQGVSLLVSPFVEVVMLAVELVDAHLADVHGFLSSGFTIGGVELTNSL